MADEMYEVTERLGITEDGCAVPEGNVESRWFYAVPGTLLPMGEARRVGLVNDDAPVEDADAESTEEADADELVDAPVEEGEAVVVEPASAEEAAASGIDENVSALDIPPETKRSRRFRKSS